MLSIRSVCRFAVGLAVCMPSGGCAYRDNNEHGAGSIMYDTFVWEENGVSDKGLKFV